MENTVNFKIKPFENNHILAESLAEEILAESLKAKDQDQPIHISLSGGSTPKVLFQTLVQDQYKDSVQWDYLNFWWGDERMVPADSPESNYGVAWEILFSKVNIPKDNLHPVLGENSLEEEVIRYAEAMKALMAVSNDLPIYDWVILGMGDDGHTASLFPGGAPLDADSITLPATHPTSGQKRVSLSLKTINAAKRVSFLVTGDNKKERLLEIFTDRDKHLHYPAACVENSHLEWWLDHPAMKLLPEKI